MRVSFQMKEVFVVMLSVCMDCAGVCLLMLSVCMCCAGVCHVNGNAQCVHGLCRCLSC